jgi:FMN-dependent NADH-azoreductase
MKLLHIDAGITGSNSVTRQLSAVAVDALATANPNLEIVYRDLDADPIPHLDSRKLASLQDNEVLKEFMDADVLVIGAPMYNFGIPSQLKSWIDHILVAGKTFRYTDTGAEGLAGAKKVIIASARGGIYAPGGPLAAIDFQEPHLKTLFRFLGIEQLTVIRAEGVAIGPEQRAAAIEEALAAAPNLAEAALAA